MIITMLKKLETLAGSIPDQKEKTSFVPSSRPRIKGENIRHFGQNLD